MEILWPSLKEQVPTVYLARSAFRLHCISDPAWNKDFDLIQIEEIVGRLS